MATISIVFPSSDGASFDYQYDREYTCRSCWTDGVSLAWRKLSFSAV